MARKREIHPGFFKNEDIAEMSYPARLMLIGIWNVADREGRLEDRPKKLRGEILPYDNCNGEELVAEIAAKGFIIRYEIGGNKYIQVNNWHKYQDIHPKESPSIIPAFPENNPGTTQDDSKVNLGNTQEQPRENPGVTQDDSFHPIPSYTSFPSCTSCTSIPSQKDDDDTARAKVTKVYQNEIGVVSDMARDRLHSWIDDYSADWVLAAIEEAVLHNARSPKYIDSILKGWRVHGFKVRPSDKSKTARGKPRDSRLSMIESVRRQFADAGG